MPAQPTWFHHLPIAVAELEQLPCPTVDRQTLERLLHLKKSQAWRVLKQLGASPLAGGLAINREELLEKLRAIQQQAPCEQEQRRHQRVATHLDELRKTIRARQVVIPAAADLYSRGLPDLPAGISLQPGRLIIEFHGAPDLLAKLLEISMAAANDYEAFVQGVEG